MKTIKLINSYFFGVEEIETLDAIWFYGFIVFCTVVFAAITLAKL